MKSDEINQIIEHYYGKQIKKAKHLTGGISFETLWIQMEDGHEAVFRAGNNYVTDGGRKISIRDVFERERFFYDTVNRELSIKCPDIYIIDDSNIFYEKTFELYDYMKGVSLQEIFYTMSEEEKKDVFEQMGRQIAEVNNLKINPDNPFVRQRGSWSVYFSNRLRERLSAIVKSQVISLDEMEKISFWAALWVGEERDYSYLHLDVRLNNFLWNKKLCALLDAENSEWGDPYFELARIDAYGMLNHHFLKGYFQMSVSEKPSFHSMVYQLYKLESLAFLYDIFQNEIQSEEAVYYQHEFLKQKKEILQRIGDK